VLTGEITDPFTASEFVDPAQAMLTIHRQDVSVFVLRQALTLLTARLYCAVTYVLSDGKQSSKIRMPCAFETDHLTIKMAMGLKQGRMHFTLDTA